MSYHTFVNAPESDAPTGSFETFEAFDTLRDERDYALSPGWYWWACFPGCLPDGDPIGPFATEAEAIADAQL